MKPHQHTTPLGARTTPSEVCGWAQALTRLHIRIAPLFSSISTLPSRFTRLFCTGYAYYAEVNNQWPESMRIYLKVYTPILFQMNVPIVSQVYGEKLCTFL